MSTITKIFDEFQSRKDEIEVSVQSVIKDFEKFKDKIVLYGAGSSGIAFLYFLRKIGIEPAFFADGDVKKDGTLCEGVPVIYIDRIVENAGTDALVIVCINTDGKRYCKSFEEALRVGGHHGVYQRLRECGCNHIVDYTFFRHCFRLFKDEKYNAPSCSDIFLMLEHQAEIERVYDLLADEESKDIFEKIVRFRLLDDTLEIPTLPQEQQYFEAEFYEKDDNAVFVDCGAFNGISLKTFLGVNNGRFCEYYGIEPELGSYHQLCDYVQTLPVEYQAKMHCISAAVWKDDKGQRLYELHGPGSFLADIGTTEVQTVTIDGLLQGRSASYIKMNIEGSEKEALLGAENTLKVYKPKLAIAGYHRTDDLWEIPLFIHRCNSNYKLHIRSYMNHISFVYYAN